MQYLILSPNYTGSCIKNEFSGSVDLDQLSLPKELEQEIVAWHEEYKKIIPLDENQRKSIVDHIEKLDQTGVALAKKIVDSIDGGAKIKYFSEGHLKYIPIKI